MPPTGLRPGPRESEEYELVAHGEYGGDVTLQNGSLAPKSHGDGIDEPSGLDDNEETHIDEHEDHGLISRQSRFHVTNDLGRLSGGLKIVVELISQSTLSLLASVVGSVMTGVVFDQVQFYPAFTRIAELFILVPVLLNLKGCLEMNLASRLSTSANIGELDLKRTRHAIIIGNLALLQVQALLIGALAGLLSFVLGYVTKPHRETWFESALMIVSSMMGASLSSVVLSSFMSSLVLVSRRFRVNPDNIATPLASSFGDLITLIILTFLSSLLVNAIRTYWATALLILLSCALPGFIILVWRNPYVSELLFEGWTATIMSMVISSGSGVLLQKFVNDYDALPLILPVTASLAGNVGCIFASRLSTEFHANQQNPTFNQTVSIKSRDNVIVISTLFAISLPIHLAFLGFIRLLGTFQFGVLFFFVYLIIGGISILASLVLAYWASKLCWIRGYNPDNFVLGLISAMMDVVVTTMLVVGFKIAG